MYNWNGRLEMKTASNNIKQRNHRSKARKLLFYFEILVCRVLVAIDLHIGHVPFLRSRRLIHLDEALTLGRPGWSTTSHGHPHDDGRHQGHSRESQGEIDALPVLAVVEFPSNGVRLESEEEKKIRLKSVSKVDNDALVQQIIGEILYLRDVSIKSGSDWWNNQKLTALLSVY